MKKIVELLQKTLWILNINKKRRRIEKLQFKLEKQELSLFELIKKYNRKFYKTYD